MSLIFRETALDSYRVNLSGPLNVSRLQDVVQLFRELSNDGIQQVAVNLEDVSFIDSQGLRALIAGYKIFGNDARNFRLFGIQDQPRLVFELTGFDHVFQTNGHSTNDGPDVLTLGLPVHMLLQYEAYASTT